MSFLSQAGAGQLKVQTSARPLSKVIADPETSTETTELLRQVPAIKAYAEKQGLNATKSYEKYVAVDGDAVVWVVTACPEFSLMPKTWKFPIVGSFSYLGWFKRERAESHAEKLRGEGWDVHVRGASAYSTLGWFKDPIFSTMLGRGELAEALLAETILHESLHATIYVKNQSYFNESLAQFVGETMAMEYLDENHGAADDYARWLELRKKRSEGFARAFTELSDLYQLEVSDEEKRAEKERILTALQVDLKLPNPLNNAALSGARTYDSGLEAFEKLFDESERDWAAFLARLSGLRPDSFSRHQQAEFAVVLEDLH
ncbi:MAG: aminopeptidase [Candidatus Hydrogenedentota bacterium]